MARLLPRPQAVADPLLRRLPAARVREVMGQLVQVLLQILRTDRLQCQPRPFVLPRSPPQAKHIVEHLPDEGVVKPAALPQVPAQRARTRLRVRGSVPLFDHQMRPQPLVEHLQ